MIVIFTQIYYIAFICFFIYIQYIVQYAYIFILGGVRTCVHVSGGVGCPIFLGVLSLRRVHMYQCWHGIGNLCHESREKKK